MADLVNYESGVFLRNYEITSLASSGNRQNYDPVPFGSATKFRSHVDEPGWPAVLP